MVSLDAFDVQNPLFAPRFGVYAPDGSSLSPPRSQGLHHSRSVPAFQPALRNEGPDVPATPSPDDHSFQRAHLEQAPSVQFNPLPGFSHRDLAYFLVMNETGLLLEEAKQRWDDLMNSAAAAASRSE